VYVVYDGTKVVNGLRKRVKKRFPTGWGRTGLKREVKLFWAEKLREGKKPTILDANRVPLFGPDSMTAQVEREQQRIARQRAELAEQRAREAGTLFDISPDQLPD
jgi:hypothetical protein